MLLCSWYGRFLCILDRRISLLDHFFEQVIDREAIFVRHELNLGVNVVVGPVSTIFEAESPIFFAYICHFVLKKGLNEINSVPFIHS